MLKGISPVISPEVMYAMMCMGHGEELVLADADLDLDRFLKLSGEYFDRFIDENPPVLSDNIADKRDEFLEMMDFDEVYEDEDQTNTTEE